MSTKVIICGIDELLHYRTSRISHVLSILDPGSDRPPEFERWGQHEITELRFHDIIDDGSETGMEPPAVHHVKTILEFGRKLPWNQPFRLLIHCHGGISRSTASAILVLAQREPSRDPDEIVREIANDRPQAWPNLRIIEFGDHILEAGGRLVAAARRRYRDVLTTRPELAEEFRAAGRGREVDGG